MIYRDSFTTFIKSENRDGSNRASSYIRAIDLLDSIIERKAPKEFQFGSIWDISSAKHVQILYEYVLEQRRLDGDGIFNGEEPASYWRNNYCSAALKSYKEFLVTHLYEQQMWETYQDSNVAPDQLPSLLANIDVESAEVLVDEKDLDFKTREGREAVREVKTRIGQGFFRKMILSQYQTQCCITGLNVPEVLRASHITGWAEDPKNRMNPSNGLCLSATYDAAFDKHLISFDDSYRMILSPALGECYENKAFKEYFLEREGSKLSMPTCYLPDLELLKRHRDRMVG